MKCLESISSRACLTCTIAGAIVLLGVALLFSKHTGYGTLQSLYDVASAATRIVGERGNGHTARGPDRARGQKQAYSAANKCISDGEWILNGTLDTNWTSAPSKLAEVCRTIPNYEFKSSMCSFPAFSEDSFCKRYSKMKIVIGGDSLAAGIFEDLRRRLSGDFEADDTEGVGFGFTCFIGCAKICFYTTTVLYSGEAGECQSTEDHARNVTLAIRTLSRFDRVVFLTGHWWVSPVKFRNCDPVRFYNKSIQPLMYSLRDRFVMVLPHTGHCELPSEKKVDYGWARIRMVQLWTKAFAEEHNVCYLDLYNTLTVRGDAHNHPDCLHFCVGSTALRFYNDVLWSFAAPSRQRT